MDRPDGCVSQAEALCRVLFRLVRRFPFEGLIELHVEYVLGAHLAGAPATPGCHAIDYFERRRAAFTAEFTETMEIHSGSGRSVVTGRSIGSKVSFFRNCHVFTNKDRVYAVRLKMTNLFL